MTHLLHRFLVATQHLTAADAIRLTSWVEATR